MTREEAINILNNLKPTNTKSSFDAYVVGNAITMAIKALEQEPCKVSEYDKDHIWYKGCQYISLRRFLEVKAETEQESSGDLISRQEVIDACEQSINILEAVDRIMDLPSVEQEPKTGHWIEKDGFDGDVYYDCSECGESWTTIEGTPWQNGMAYCPNCGARMVGEEDVSQ